MTPISDATLAHLREVADRPDLTGTTYELLEPLGRGGMGSVYLVWDRELDRAVALKVLNDPDPDPDAGARLTAEARTVARLEHPGIVPVHEVGTLVDGRIFYTMKRVSGTRLDLLIRERPSRAERLRLFERVAEPVAFAHSQGFVHRDLKPENIMVGSFGEVLVMDWGLAFALREAAFDGSRSGLRAVGTPGYMAPEQARGGPVDPRSDVYSLGAVLHFLLTGKTPATCTDDTTVSGPGAGHSSPPSPSPRRVDPGIPKPLESICLRAMAEDPAERYPSVPDLAADVARFLDGGRVLAHRETWIERGSRFVHRYRAPIALILAYLVMRAVLLFLPGR